jgi:hypothetical protein
VTLFSLWHSASDGWFSFTSVVGHPSKESKVSVVASDVAAGIKETEGDGAEADAPAAIRDGLEADELVSQAVAEVPLCLANTDDAV